MESAVVEVNHTEKNAFITNFTDINLHTPLVP